MKFRLGILLNAVDSLVCRLEDHRQTDCWVLYLKIRYGRDHVQNMRNTRLAGVTQGFQASRRDRKSVV
jgi:hypothetical protein